MIEHRAGEEIQARFLNQGRKADYVWEMSSTPAAVLTYWGQRQMLSTHSASLVHWGAHTHTHTHSHVSDALYLREQFSPFLLTHPSILFSSRRLPADIATMETHSDVTHYTTMITTSSHSRTLLSLLSSVTVIRCSSQAPFTLGPHQFIHTAERDTPYYRQP